MRAEVVARISFGRALVRYADIEELALIEGQGNDVVAVHGRHFEEIELFLSDKIAERLTEHTFIFAHTIVIACGQRLTGLRIGKLPGQLIDGHQKIARRPSDSSSPR